MFDTIANWWSAKSENFQRLFLACVLGAPGFLYAGYKLYETTMELWGREVMEISALTTSYTTIPDDKIKPSDLEELKNYNSQTSVALPNDTSKQFTNVVILFPKRGHVALFDNAGSLLSFGKFDGRLEIPRIPPISTYSLTIWYTRSDPKSGDDITFSSHESGKIVVPFASPSELVTYRYKWGFWAVTLLLFMYCIWDAVKWTNRKLKGQEPGPIVAN